MKVILKNQKHNTSECPNLLTCQIIIYMIKIYHSNKKTPYFFWTTTFYIYNNRYAIRRIKLN